MKREIKFRGYQPELKKWVYGDLIHTSWADFIFSYDGNFEDRVKVDSDSVGQFTGLYDKDGKEVFDGDILQIDNTDDVDMWCRGEMGIVEYKPARFSFVFMNGKERKTMNADFETCCQVIGNIYQNPELLNIQR